MRIAIQLVQVWICLLHTTRSSVDDWLSKCPRSDSPCCSVWHRFVMKSERARRSFLASELNPKLAALDAFDRYEPDWACDALSRVPPVGGDGPKWMCGAEHLPTDALVYSFGCNGDTQFEEGLRVIVPSADMYIFDPTMSRAMVAAVKGRGFRLIETGLVPLNASSFIHEKQPAAGTDLIRHMSLLGHTGHTIHVLKIDVDGSEFASLSGIAVGDCNDADVRIDQLLIETHAYPNKVEGVREKIVQLMAQLNACNMRLFSKERNHWGCAGFKCVEFSFVGPTHAFEVFKASHPSCAMF